MTDRNRNLLTRFLTAVVALPVVLYLLYWGGYPAAVLFGFAAAVCVFEYQTIVLKTVSPAGWVAVGLAFVLPLVPVAVPSATAGLAVAFAWTVMIVGWLYHLFRGTLQDAPGRAAHLVTSFVYGAGGLASLAVIRQLPDGGWWVVVALVITWGNDTAAYFFGRFFGRHKLYPKVSPNKTWEGFLGGFVGGIGFMFVLRAFFWPGATVLDCVALGFVGSLLGPAGDLCESMLKRAFDVKDSGKVIPGHGGMLDRIDALIFNAPLVLLYVEYLRPR